MRRGCLFIGLDLLFMSANFSALTLFSVLSSYLSSELGLNSFWEQVAASMYSAGIFAAFFIGHSRLVEKHPEYIVVLAALLASIPQFIIPLTSNPYIISTLRFIQGLVMMVIPIFSSQIRVLCPEIRPLALGIILSGIFIGGFIGSYTAPLVALVTGWRNAFMFYGVLMLVTAIIWFILTPRDILWVRHDEYEVSIGEASVWREKFTIIWGFSFFPAIWIIFTLAPLISFIVRDMGFSENMCETASTVLEASYLSWSIIIGFTAYVLVRNKSKTPRSVFNVFSKLQLLCFIIAFIGVLIVLNTHNLEYLLLGIILIGIIQGTGPTFWSTPSIAYPEYMVVRAGYALGLISNSAALMGPLISIIVRDAVMNWLVLSIMMIIGAVNTFIGSYTVLPIEKYCGEKKIL